MEDNEIPIIEFYNDEMVNLSVFFSNGKKEFWRFEECKKLGIDKCIFFFPRDFRKIKNIYSKCKLIYRFKSASSISPVYLYDKKVLIALCPLGGPASANLMEELVYVGIKTFIGVGSCGAIVDVNFDHFFVPVKAIRDEGTSYHYLAASKFVDSTKRVVTAISSVLKNHKEIYNNGVIWTTDAIYRETPRRIQARVNDGATAVDMEHASLCAVAKSRKVEYGCLMYYSDVNNGQKWQTRSYDKFELRERVIRYAVEAMEKL